MRKLVFALLSLPGAAFAESPCKIETSPSKVYEVRERSIILASYKDLVLRAASGKIRCDENKSQGRYECVVSGKGEIFVEGGERGAMVANFLTDATGTAHFYPSGDVSCGLKSDF